VVLAFEQIATTAAGRGVAVRGAFHPTVEDGMPSSPGTLVMLGLVGRAQWPIFAASAEASDRAANPLDRWSRRIIDALAAELGATALYPFGGPPWLPFQRWAMRAEPVHRSPLGMLIHPDWGLWHSYRGALAFAQRLPLPIRVERPSPCDACAAKPCLHACPVGAFTLERYNVDACAGHIRGTAGKDCVELGCRARDACPVGADHRFAPEQANFHMRAFLASRNAGSDV
jgi:hypothetical protein